MAEQLDIIQTNIEILATKLVSYQEDIKFYNEQIDGSEKKITDLQDKLEKYTSEVAELIDERQEIIDKYNKRVYLHRALKYKANLIQGLPCDHGMPNELQPSDQQTSDDDEEYGENKDCDLGDPSQHEEIQKILGKKDIRGNSICTEEDKKQALNIMFGEDQELWNYRMKRKKMLATYEKEKNKTNIQPPLLENPDNEIIPSETH